MKRMRNSSLWLALVLGVALSWPLGASEASERAAVSKSGVGPRIKAVVCDNAVVRALDVSGCTALAGLDCRSNDLRSLDVSRNVNLEILYCSGNRLPLSVMAKAVTRPADGRDWETEGTPQRIPVSLETGQVLDLSKEMTFFGHATEVDFGYIAAKDYTFTNGRLKFSKAGQYRICLRHDSIRDYSYGAYTDVVEVFYDITVESGVPDDPDDPDEPTDPGVANEDLASDEAASAPWAYVQGRTIYLTSDAPGGAGLGEVEAFTAVGQRVYRGHDRSFTVPTAGVYVLRTADGSRCKVMVR